MTGRKPDYSEELCYTRSESWMICDGVYLTCRHGASAEVWVLTFPDLRSNIEEIRVNPEQMLDSLGRILHADEQDSQ